uniref:Putative secreted protein n=1 Tax=Panstrongylus lignarius TaxID=156445 RepID=A0A224XU68_9HEMI
MSLVLANSCCVLSNASFLACFLIFFAESMAKFVKSLDNSLANSRCATTASYFEIASNWSLLRSLPFFCKSR